MKIERQTLAQQVLDRLIIRLTEKNYHPGDKLATEQELMEEFVVSRSSVREAIKALQNLGILESKPARGTFISTRKDTYARLLIFASLLSQDSRSNLVEFQFALEMRSLMTLHKDILAADAGKRQAEKKLVKENTAALQEALSSNRRSRTPENDLLAAGKAAHHAVIRYPGDTLITQIAVSLLDFLARELWLKLELPQLTELMKGYLSLLKTLGRDEDEAFFVELNKYYRINKDIFRQMVAQESEVALA